jgi:hypothetical protein
MALRLFERVLCKDAPSKGATASPDAHEQTRWSDGNGRVDQSMTSKSFETEMSYIKPPATLRGQRSIMASRLREAFDS